jgi:hypothetical protein
MHIHERRICICTLSTCLLFVHTCAHMRYIYKRMFVLFQLSRVLCSSNEHIQGVFKSACVRRKWVGEGEPDPLASLLIIIGALAKFDTCSNGGKNFDSSRLGYIGDVPCIFERNFMPLFDLLIGISRDQIQGDTRMLHRNLRFFGLTAHV